MNIMKGIAGTGCLALPVVVKNVELVFLFYIGRYFMGYCSLYCGIRWLHSRFLPTHLNE